MAAKLTRLTHKIAMQLHLVADNFIICSSRSRRPVQKLLDTPSYIVDWRGIIIMNCESVRIRKEAIMTYLKILIRHSPPGTEE